MGVSRTFTCDCCQHQEPLTAETKIWSNPLLLGCDAALCHFCFSVWYDEHWETSGFHCAELAPDTYLLTYTLVQDKARVTRRSSIWRRALDGWKILYHQGTLVEAV